MDKRNLKKTEQPDRKQEKRDTGALKRVEKQVKKTVDSDTNDAKVHPDIGDLKKAEKQTKKVVVVDISDARLPPDRGDLKKSEKQPKKVVKSDTKVLADRGDLKKTDRSAKKTSDMDTNDPKRSLHPDRGDSARKIIKVDKPKLTVIIKKSDDKAKILEHRASKEIVKKLDTETIKTVSSEDRRKIREKYTLKLKTPSVVAPTLNKKEEQPKSGNNFKPEIKNDRAPKKANDTSREKSEDSNESKQSVNTINKSDKNSFQRKPIIRTILTKKDTTKIYKAVTFVDQKKNKPTLQIKIPNEIAKNPKNLKSNETMTVKRVNPTLSGVSIKDKVNRKKSGKKKADKSHRLVTSPNLSTKVQSPPTEVAKWAPSSINRHTKPYYEAWVSTTLAAISKNSRKDKLFLEKQNILQSFQKALADRPETPELMYENFTDERYTGKIKVKQR